MSEFSAIVSLYDFWSISKVVYAAFDKIDCRITTLFHIWIDKALSRSFIKHGVLIKLLRNGASIAGGWNVFDIHLPLNS